MNDTIEQLSKWGPEWLLIFGLLLATGYLVRYLLRQGREDVEKMTASRVKLADGVRSLTAAIRSMGDGIEAHGKRIDQLERRIAEQGRDR